VGQHGADKSRQGSGSDQTNGQTDGYELHAFSNDQMEDVHTLSAERDTNTNLL
jgi:hypothetical protein